MSIIYDTSREDLAAMTLRLNELVAAAEAMCAHIEDIGAAGALAIAADPIATARYDALRAAVEKARGKS